MEKVGKNKMRGATMHFECHPYSGVPLYEIPFKQEHDRIPNFGNEGNIFSKSEEERQTKYSFDFDRITSDDWSCFDEPLRGVLDFIARLNPIFLSRGKRQRGF